MKHETVSKAYFQVDAPCNESSYVYHCFRDVTCEPRDNDTESVSCFI
jgi:hypothetical protein